MFYKFRNPKGEPNVTDNRVIRENISALPAERDTLDRVDVILNRDENRGVTTIDFYTTKYSPEMHSIRDSLRVSGLTGHN